MFFRSFSYQTVFDRYRNARAASRVIHAIMTPNGPATELVLAPFEPLLVDENTTIGDHFAYFLERVRTLPYISPTIYICSHTFMTAGVILCAVEALANAPNLVRALSIVMYCTVGFSFWQTAQSSLRLIQPVVLLLARSFNIWYGFVVSEIFLNATEIF